jgi:hypothetical protein
VEEGHRLRLHCFLLADDVNIVLLEPREREFVWLSFYLSERLRNGFVSLELIKYVLGVLKGLHHVHPLREAETFQRAARQLRWRSDGQSKFFVGCNAYIAQSRRTTTKFAPYFQQSLTHEILSRIPRLATFRDQTDARETTYGIQAYFDGEIEL